MTILQLKVAVLVAQEGSVTKAAAALGNSQSNCSAAIRQLEQELGITLFTREGNKTIPTARGYTFLNYARSAVQGIDNIEKIKDTGRYYRLRVGVERYTPAINAFISFCGELGTVSNAVLQLVNVTSESGFQALAENRIDIFCALIPSYRWSEMELIEKEKQLIAVPIGETGLYINMRKGHPLELSGAFDNGKTTFSALKDYPYLDYTNFETITEGAKIMAHPNIPCKYRISVEERETRLQLLSKTDGFSIGCYMPQSNIEKYNLVSYLISDKPVKLFCFLHAGEEARYENVRYMELLREQYKSTYR